MLRRSRRTSGRGHTSFASSLSRAVRPVLEHLEQRRLLAFAGDLDNTFGGDGVATTSVGDGFGSQVWDVAVDPSDDSVVVAGWGFVDFAPRATLVRYDSAGMLDTGFGDMGVVTLSLGEFNDEINAVEIVNGKVLAVGTADGGGVFVLQYNADGTPNTDFAPGGVAFLSGISGSAVDLAVRATGEILVAVDTGVIAQLVDPAGPSTVEYDSSWGVAGSWGSAGATPVSFGAGTRLSAIALQTIGSDEYVLAAGEGAPAGDANVVVSRFDLSGTALDAAFGTGGSTTVDLGSLEGVTAMAVDSQDRIYLSVNHFGASGPDQRASVYRFTADGVHDFVNWNGNGDGVFDTGEGEAQLHEPGSSLQVNDLAIDSNDLPVITGFNASVLEVFLARFDSTGEADAAFSTQGEISTTTVDGVEAGWGVKIMADGRIVVGATTAFDFAALRYGEAGGGGAAPVADAGADQDADENSNVLIDASGSVSTGTGTIYEWDTDNNGSFETSTGATPSLVFTQDLPGLYTVGLRVTDSNGSSTDTVVITFLDVTPTADAGADQTAVRQQTVNFAGAGNNAAGDAIVLYEWDLDDNGSFETVGQNTSTVFTSTGTFTVRLRVTDDDGQTAIDTLDVTVAAAGIVGPDLVVGGTGGNDAITIRTTTVPGQLRVLFGGAEVGRFSPSGGVIVHAGAGNDSVDLGSAVTNASVFGGAGNDTLDGGAGNDYLDGGDDNDVINGRAGNDTSVGGAGNDSIANAGGNDELYGGAGNDTLVCGVGTDVAFGGDGNDSITGGVGDDVLYGEAGNDTITGGAGADLIDGGDGNDSITGGVGDDTVHGGAGADTIDAGAGNDQVFGGDENDSISAGAGDDTVYGGAGADTIDAGAGADLIDGGDGNDDLNGQAGIDIVVGGAGNDSLQGGAEQDLLVGGDGADEIVGNAAEDVLIGGILNNTSEANLKAILAIWTSGASHAARVATLQGGLLSALNLTDDSSVDTLTGGAGSDLFQHDAGDIITDPKPADTII